MPCSWPSEHTTLWSPRVLTPFCCLPFPLCSKAYYKLEISKYKGIYDTQSGIKVYGYDSTDMSTCWVVLLVNVIVFRAIAFLGLVRREK